MKKNNIIEGLLMVIVVLSTIATIRALVCYELSNLLFYIVTFVVAVFNLFSVACLFTVAATIVWQLMLPYLITWPGSILAITAYWYLFRNKRSVEYPTIIRSENGPIFSCILRTSIGIPLPWRKLQIRRTGGVLKIYQTSWFSRKNHAQNLASLCDPELEGDLFPHMFFGTSVLVLKEHASKEDKLWRKFTLTNLEGKFLAGEDDDGGFLNTLIRQARVERKNNEGGMYIN